MQTKTKLFLDFLEEKDFNYFQLSHKNNSDYLLHDETAHGISLRTIIYFEDCPCSKIVFLIANCLDRRKQTELSLLLNKLNVDERLKYYLTSEGNVCASIDYWADDNCFEARMLFDLYIIFLNIILDDKDHNIKEIMKIIWS